MARRARNRQSSVRPLRRELGGLGKTKSGASYGHETPIKPFHIAPEEVGFKPPGKAAKQAASEYLPTLPELAPPSTSAASPPQRSAPRRTSAAAAVPVSSLLTRAIDLLTPGATAKQMAEAAHTLGVQPKEQQTQIKMPTERSLEDFGSLVGGLAMGKLPSLPKQPVPQQGGRRPPTHVTIAGLYKQAGYVKSGGGWAAVGHGAPARFNRLVKQATRNMTPEQVRDFGLGKRRAPAPGSSWGPTSAQDPLGAKTLGNVTAAQLAQAQKEGKLRVSQQGVLTTPENRQVLAQLRQAREEAAASNGVSGPLTPTQKRIAMLVSKYTGGILKPATVATQELQEMSGSAALRRDAEHNYDVLNIGYTDSGPLALTGGSEWSNPNTAAKATAAFFKGEKYGPSQGISEILEKAKGKSVAEQLQIIGESGWATSAYATNLAETSKLIKENHDPAAVVALQTAKKTAQAHGINPTPWNGDVGGGGGEFTWVRADAKGMLDFAESAIGKVEGSPAIEKLANRFGLDSVTQPWCANFVSNGLIRRGFKEGQLPANPNYVPSFEEWAAAGKYAHSVGTDLSKAKPGDLLAFSGQHIGVYAGGGEMISGNFGDKVARGPISEESAPLSMIIRPGYKGGKVKVPDVEIIGTGTTESVAGSTSTEGLSGAAPIAGGGTTGGRQAAPLLPFSEVPVSQLLQTLSLAPNASVEGPLSEEEPTGTIGKLLQRRRL